MIRAFAKIFICICLMVSFAAAAGAAVGAGLNAAPTNAEIDQSLKALKIRSPERYRRILEIRESEPERFLQNVLQVAREEERLVRVKKQVPENYQLQIAMWNNREKLRSLVEEFRGENDTAGRQIIESQIDNLLGEQFDLRRQMRLNRLKLAEKRLSELRLGLRRDPAREKTQFIAEWKPKLLPIQDATRATVRAAGRDRALPAKKKAAATPFVEAESDSED